MAYDPQRNRRRPRPARDEPAPIEAILDSEAPSAATSRPADADPGAERHTTESRESGASAPVADDPPPDPSVTPQPADPWSDQLLFGVSISTIIGVIVALIVFRWLWVRSRRSNSAGEGD